MKLTLEQHIYADRLNYYTTVAESPGIGKALREEIESHVGPPPDVDEHAGYDIMVCRGYYLHDREFCALSFLQKKPHGARRSHIAHTYLLKTEALADAGWNLPWIALHLPFMADYRPQLTQDVDHLEQRVIDIDCAGQVRLLHWLLVLQPDRERLCNWVEQILLAREQQSVIEHFSFGAITGDLEQASRDLLGVDAPGSGDALNLWRMVGLFTLLPDAFQQDLSFSVNESGNQDAVLQVALNSTQASEFTLEGADYGVYMNHCLALLDVDTDGHGEHGLLTFQDAVESNLEQPSRAVLEAAAAYHWARLEAQRQDRQFTPELKAQLIMPLLAACTSPNHAALSDAIDLFQEHQLSPVLEHDLLEILVQQAFTGEMQDDRLARKLLHILLEKGATLPDRQALLEKISPIAQQQIWNDLFKYKFSPDMEISSKSLPDAIAWTIALLRGLTPEQQKWAEKKLGGSLCRMGSLKEIITTMIKLSDITNADQYGINGQQVDMFVFRLVEFVVKELCASRYRQNQGPAPLFEAIIACFSYSVDEQDALVSRHVQICGLIASVVAEEFWTHTWEWGGGAAWQWDVQNFALAVPSELSRIPSREYGGIDYNRLRGYIELECLLYAQMRDSIHDGSLKILVNVQHELLEVLSGRGHVMCRDPDQIYLELPVYCTWADRRAGGLKRITRIRRSGGSMEERHGYDKFHENLVNVISDKAWPVQDVFCLAVCYLEANPDKDNGVFTSLAMRVLNEQTAVDLWLVRDEAPSGYIHPRVSSLVMLVLFIKAYHAFDNLPERISILVRDRLSTILNKLMVRDMKSLKRLERCFNQFGTNKQLLKKSRNYML